MTGISAMDVKKKLDKNEASFILDVRDPDEYEEMRLVSGRPLFRSGCCERDLVNCLRIKTKK